MQHQNMQDNTIYGISNRKVFLLMLVFLLIYTASTGQIFGRTDGTDKYYHIIKSMFPLSYCFNEYYAPLFHIIVYCIAFFIGTFNAINIFVALLLFYLMPKMFNWVYNGLWGEDKDTTAYYFFVPFFTILMFIMNTWPQTLNMFFMLFLLGIIFRRGITPLIFCVSILGFFSHSAGGFWIIVTTLFYFFLKNKKTGAGLLLVIVLLMIFYPPIYLRPLNIINNFIGELDLSAERLLEVFLLWLNPINLYLIYCGFKERKYYELNDIVLLFAVLVSFSSAIIDSELRPILNGMLLLGLYGFKGFEMHPKIGGFLTVYGILWWITLIYGVILM